MEKIVKQIQLLTLIIILISTVIAIGSELYQMFKIQTVTLADLLLLFLYLEVLAMIRVFGKVNQYKSLYHYLLL